MKRAFLLASGLKSRLSDSIKGSSSKRKQSKSCKSRIESLVSSLKVPKSYMRMSKRSKKKPSRQRIQDKVEQVCDSEDDPPPLELLLINAKSSRRSASKYVADTGKRKVAKNQKKTYQQKYLYPGKQEVPDVYSVAESAFSGRKVCYWEMFTLEAVTKCIGLNGMEYQYKQDGTMNEIDIIDKKVRVIKEL